MKKDINDSLMAQQVNKVLAPKLEGKLFRNTCVVIGMGKVHVCTDYYTVKYGQVHIIERIHDPLETPSSYNKLTLSGDPLWQLESECELLGQYEPDKIYDRELKEMTFKQFRKALKLKV